MGPAVGKDLGLTHCPRLGFKGLQQCIYLPTTRYNTVSILLETYWFQNTKGEKIKAKIKNLFQSQKPKFTGNYLSNETVVVLDCGTRVHCLRTSVKESVPSCT